jgi:hypothetical protein
MKTFKQFLNEYSDFTEQEAQAHHEDDREILKKSEHIMSIPPEEYAKRTVRGGSRVRSVGDVSPDSQSTVVSHDAQNSNNANYDHTNNDLKDPLYHAAVKSKVTEVKQKQAQDSRTPEQNELERLAMNPSGANTPKPWSGRYQELRDRYQAQEDQANKNSSSGNVS